MGLGYYTFDRLQDMGNLTHAISTRHGGTSPPPFDTLNLSITVGDAPTNVSTNIRRLHNTLTLDESSTVTASQAQADQVALVGANQRGTTVKGVDALITDQPKLSLLLRYADCVPIFLYDPMHRAIGLVHAGWRGTLAQIAAKSVRAMQEAFGTRARDMIGCIGPSIGPCCYRVGHDVIALFRGAIDDADSLLVRRDGFVHLDLWQANANQLRAAGIEQIEIAGICTADQTGDFYSWRAEKTKTGRFGAIIEMN